jgi:DNA-binding NarL/FixJ family response regulator
MEALHVGRSEARAASPLNPKRSRAQIAGLCRELTALRRRLAEVLSQLVEAGVQTPGVDIGALGCLSARERQVALLFAEVPSDKAVASVLGTSVQTVRNQISCIRHKLGVRSRGELLLRLVHARGQENGS